MQPDKSQDFVAFIGWGTTILSLLIVFIVIFLFYYKEKHASFLKKEASFQQTLLQAQLEIQEQTFQHISREIHDNIGQSLILAKLELSTIDDELPKAMQQKIIASKSIITTVLKDLRNLSHSISSDFINELGLTKAIQHELDIVSKSVPFIPFLVVEGEQHYIGKERELILFRMFQEAIQNVIKHANAKTVTVSLRYEIDSICFGIKDDGVGFENETPTHQKPFSLGMKNMIKRGEQLGSILAINTSPGNGTEILINVPYLIHA